MINRAITLVLQGRAVNGRVKQRDDKNGGKEFMMARFWSTSMRSALLFPVAVVICFGTFSALAQSPRPAPPTMERSSKPAQAQPPQRSGKHKPHSVELKWQASKTKGIEGYYIYRAAGEATGKFERITPKPIKVTEFKDKKVEAGKTYSYAVSSVQKIGHKELESDRTPAITVKIPEP